MFGCGMLACKYFKIISKVLQWAPILIIPAIIMATYGDGILFGAAGNRMGGFYFLCFVAILLWFAFWLPPIPFRIDISYGLFLWHMPIINFLSVVDPSISVCRLLTAIIAIYAIALLSFILIEKPVSKLKLQL
jgi:peptidoglycan/LPS O-acetylase OafA/YrhL